ncbi:hypothetical protein CABS01_05371 [Colletotrichum abscissum]|uniref:uncharacterized protein n=1 Tax=Colletotrichum abscissum TaxID=1671311 RepID=UPI0027D6BCC4|nr:uncharacterized protein CABS01_05371 [Colletotrichum abscissum]KAK1520866.1 hypothetical protein CABS01_05371 [Colletotrichum abscissum]KAK1712461.1 hypothetical protein BDP67DRAFT_490349 [Colletotrichum lupini]
MFIDILRDASANFAAYFKEVRRCFQRIYRRAYGQDESSQQDEEIQQRGRAANSLIILIVGIFTTNFSMSGSTVAQLVFGIVYGIAVSALYLPMNRRTRLRTGLALAGVLPGAVYIFSDGLTLHIVSMIIISAAAGIETQRHFRIRSNGGIDDSVLRPQSSVECLLVTWLVVVCGNAKEVSHFIQAGVVLCLDVLSSTTATQVLMRFFLRVILVTMAIACLVQQFLPLSRSMILDRRSEVADVSQRQNVWPRAEVLTVVGFFVTPGMALLYKEVREELCPRLYRWLLGRGRPRENEERVFPENDDLPTWSDLEEARELRAGVEQWMN